MFTSHLNMHFLSLIFETLCISLEPSTLFKTLTKIPVQLKMDPDILNHF